MEQRPGPPVNGIRRERIHVLMDGNQRIGRRGRPHTRRAPARLVAHPRSRRCPEPRVHFGFVESGLTARRASRASGVLSCHIRPFTLVSASMPRPNRAGAVGRPTGRSGRAAVSGTREHPVAGAALGGGAAPCRRRRVPIVVMISAAAGGRRGRAARPGAVPGPHRFGAATVFHLQPIDSKYISRRRRHHRGTPGAAQAPQASAHFKPSKRFLCTDGQASRHPWTKSPAICQQPGCLQVNMLIYKG